MNWIKQIQRVRSSEIPKIYQDRLEKIAKNGKNGYMAGAEPFFIYPSTQVGVLLLHGFTSTPAQFMELAEYLAGKGVSVYAPLIAGHGTKPDDLKKTTAKDWIESCQKALDELCEKVEKVFVLGNSFGGNIAFKLSIDYPEKVAGVISVGTPVWIRGHRWRKYRAFTYGYWRKYWRKPRAFFRSSTPRIIDEITYSKIPLPAAREFFRIIQQTYKMMPKVKAPTFIIQADIDPIVNPKSALRIHDCLGSKDKRICWLNDSFSHSMMEDERRGDIYKKIYSFIEEIYHRKR